MSYPADEAEVIQEERERACRILWARYQSLVDGCTWADLNFDKLHHLIVQIAAEIES